MESSALPATEEAILFSSFTNFEIDDGSGQLSLNPQAEIDTETKSVAWQQDFLKWGVRSEVKNIYQGQYEDIPACLVVLRFTLSIESAIGLGRISEAKIIVKVGQHHDDNAVLETSVQATPEHSIPGQAIDKADDSVFWRIWRSFGFGSPDDGNAVKEVVQTHYPHVAMICPKSLHGEASTAQINNIDGISAGPEYVNVYGEREVSREQKYAIKVRGQRWLDKKTGSANIARWLITENSSQGTGIPSDFYCGIVYQHNEKPFDLTVDVRLRTKTGLHLFGRPWSPLKPVVIRKRTQFGNATTPEDFGSMTLDNWISLCPANWSEDDGKGVWLDK